MRVTAVPLASVYASYHRRWRRTSALEKKLANPEFPARAQAALVEQEKKWLTELGDARAELQAGLARLGNELERAFNQE